MDYAEKEAYGVTKKSTEFVKVHLPMLASIVLIECLLAGNTHSQFGGEQWVAFVDEKGGRIVVSGFGWGYAGEGPSGLYEMAQELGFNLDLDTITHYPRAEYWETFRDRMILTERLAGYIVSLQSVSDMEVGLGKEDYTIRDQLELEFPNLKWEREQQEFNEWLWGTRTEEELDVVEARFLLGHHIPFDDIYWADSKANLGQIIDPDAPESTYNLYREHTEIAGVIFQETKQNAKARLVAQDAADKINLQRQWGAYKAVTAGTIRLELTSRNPLQ